MNANNRSLLNTALPILQGLLASGHYTARNEIGIPGTINGRHKPWAVQESVILAIQLLKEVELYEQAESARKKEIPGLAAPESAVLQ